MIELLIAFIAILFLYYLKNYVFDSDSFDNEDYNPDYNPDDNPDDNCVKDISGNISNDISSNMFSVYNPNDKYVKKNAYEKNEYVKESTIESVFDYPNESIDLLYDASFKPECCPSTYTNSNGCLCYEPQNFNLLATRGGNSMSNPL